MLRAIEPFGEALAHDGMVQFGLAGQVPGVFEEIFVSATKFFKVWTSRPR